MAVKQSSEALRRPQKALWVIFPVIAVGSLVLGFIGLSSHIRGPNSWGHRIDLLYWDLQLFVLGSDPLQQPGRLPVVLNIARFTAPAVTIYAVFEAVRRLLAVEVSRIRARRSKAHAIVCGDTPFADALTRRLQAQGVTVVEIRTQPDDFVTPGEPLRIIGDARDPQVLHDAGLEHASWLYACAQESATNIAVALAVSRVDRKSNELLFVYSLVTDPDFCATVQAFFLGRPSPGQVRLDFFNIDHIAARKLFTTDHSGALIGRPPRILVAGTDAFAQAIVVEAARYWRASRPQSGPALPLVMVGPDAAEVIDGLTHRYPFLDAVCSFDVLDADLLTLIRNGELHEPSDRVLITYRDEEHALKTAMAAERYWRGRSGPITVRMDGAMIGGAGASGRLEVAAGTLRVFGAVAAAADPELIRDDLTERLARVLHGRYLHGRRSRGDVRGQGDVRAEKAMVCWEDLPPQLRLANRMQAEDIGRKLARIGCVITPRYTEQQEAALGPADVDQLAMMEHDRWSTEKEQAGWRYAPHLDEERKLHPALLGWDELPETMRARNYDPFRELPSILGEAGFQIVRA